MNFLKIYCIEIKLAAYWINFDIFNDKENIILFRYRVPMLENESLTNEELNIVMERLNKYLT